ncbi:acyl-CoA thioesterase [Natranaerofaba carboxydovora]|uniref:acyl-CoA thioesterase n=1 Tax=Natranaerofaba carboxydovora TaxID=2742683 RepID=UPI001F13C11B|nr:thioesterase family protein [Natranaerofaba carboxydovora]UMZ75482.1 Putative esterase [Natranaerofaba carboxydovora]
MPKIENIIQPDKETWLKKFRFSTDTRVRFCETDAFGHLNNVSYFIYFEQARLDYFRELALTEKLLNDNQLYIVTADLYCQFLGEVYFDEELEVKLRTTKLGNTSFDLEYGLIRKEKGIVAATGRGAIVLVDKHSHKSTPLPDDLKNIIKEYEPEL